MSKRVVELFLFDIYVAILKIEEIARLHDSADTLKYNFMAWDSAIREFEIIGEATNKLIKYGVLDDSNRVVVDFRNLLIHNYFGIDEYELWDVITNDLPIFKTNISYAISQIDLSLKNEIIKEIIAENSHLDFMKNIEILT